jgi:hypothetical protein
LANLDPPTNPIPVKKRKAGLLNRADVTAIHRYSSITLRLTLRTGPRCSVPDFGVGLREGGAVLVLLAKSDISRKLTDSAPSNIKKLIFSERLYQIEVFCPFP